ncbi:ADAM DEC1 [Ctenodactylus gundi]
MAVVSAADSSWAQCRQCQQCELNNRAEVSRTSCAIAIRESPPLKLHEIVYPKILHIKHERGMENNQTEKHSKEQTHGPEVQYQILLKGEEIILHLQKAKYLLGPDNTEAYYSHRGDRITRRPRDIKLCYYEGHILNENDSVASISTCDGLRGYFTHHGQTYLIEPLQGTHQREHVVLTYNQEEPGAVNRMCGMRRGDRKRNHCRTSRSLKSAQQEAFFHGQKYIDLFLVLDHAFYNMYNMNITRIRSFVFDVLNLLNVIYNTIDIQVALVGLEIWSDGDKIKVEPNIGNTFNNFLQWHVSKRAKDKIHDHAQLLSGIGFNNRRVGMAASNSLCSPPSVAVIEAKKKNSVSLVGVMSHELGHVLGMPDVPYFTKCPSGSCVMNQYLSSKFPKDFSDIARSSFQRYLASQKPKCLLQAPRPENIITKPVCGNHLLEVGEDCDCGSPKKCTDPCCEAAACKLRSRSQCRPATANCVHVCYEEKGTIGTGRARYFAILIIRRKKGKNFGKLTDQYSYRNILSSFSKTTLESEYLRNKPSQTRGLCDSAWYHFAAMVC